MTQNPIDNIITQELLPCPFCGESNIELCTHRIPNYIKCSGCGVIMESLVPPLMWNTRTPNLQDNEKQNMNNKTQELDFKLEVGGRYRTRNGKEAVITAIEDIPEEMRTKLSNPNYIAHGYVLLNSWNYHVWTIEGRGSVLNSSEYDIVAKKSLLDDSPEWLREAVRNGGWCKTRGGDKVWVYATPIEIINELIYLGRAYILCLNSYGYAYSIYLDGRYVRGTNNDKDLIGPWTDD